MCSCFDNQLENKQEMHLQQHLSEPFIHSENGSPNEVVGFSYEQILARIQPATDRFLELFSEGIEGYDTITDKENCKVYSKAASEGYVLKYIWYIQYTPKQFRDFMDRVDLRKNWDKNIDSVQVLGEFSEDEAIMLTKYKKYLTFEPRETLTYSKSLRHKENLVDVSFSVESALYPVPPKTVRVSLFVAGIYTESIEPDETGNITRIICLSHMDIGLPKAFNDMARKFAGTSIPPLTKKISAELKKFYAKQ